MLPFFRKIRYRLASDNQFFKYSRYAIGEIVLVVIGILIALAINNWNEERKNEKRIVEIFTEVQRDILLNLQSIESTISIQSRQDSLLRSILSDTLELQDYLEFPELIFPIGYYSAPTVNSGGFEKLKNNQNEIPDKLVGVYDTIKMAFGLFERNMDYAIVYADAVNRNNEAAVEDWKWFSKVQQGGKENWNPETLDYLINNPFYKNRVHQFRFILDDQNWLLQRQVNFWIYTIISEITGVNNSPKIYSYLLESRADDITGTYKWKDSVLDKNWGVRKIYFDPFLMYQNIAFYELSKDSFANYYNNTLYFKRDSLGKVTGATRYWEGQFNELEKID